MNVHVSVLSIGALAEAAGVSAPTIRYYEEIGLLPPAARSPSGQRVYSEVDLPRITFIKRCRNFGFSIGQVRVMVGLSISPDRDCIEARDIAQAHLEEVRSKLADLQLLEHNLEGFVANCNAICAGGRGRDCVIFKDLANPLTAQAQCCGPGEDTRPISAALVSEPATAAQKRMRSRPRSLRQQN